MTRAASAHRASDALRNAVSPETRKGLHAFAGSSVPADAHAIAEPAPALNAEHRPDNVRGLEARE